MRKIESLLLFTKLDLPLCILIINKSRWIEKEPPFPQYIAENRNFPFPSMTPGRSAKQSILLSYLLLLRKRISHWNFFLFSRLWQSWICQSQIAFGSTNLSEPLLFLWLIHTTWERDWDRHRELDQWNWKPDSMWTLPGLLRIMRCTHFANPKSNVKSWLKMIIFIFRGWGGWG